MFIFNYLYIDREQKKLKHVLKYACTEEFALYGEVYF